MANTELASRIVWEMITNESDRGMLRLASPDTVKSTIKSYAGNAVRIADAIEAEVDAQIMKEPFFRSWFK